MNAEQGMMNIEMAAVKLHRSYTLVHYSIFFF